MHHSFNRMSLLIVISTCLKLKLELCIILVCIICIILYHNTVCEMENYSLASITATTKGSSQGFKYLYFEASKVLEDTSE